MECGGTVTILGQIPGRHGNLPCSLPGRYQVRLNPAVMLFFGVVVPASSIEVVSLSGPTKVCSMLSLLCHWVSTVDAPAPAENVVPDGSTLSRTVSSTPQAGAGAAAPVFGIPAVGGTPGRAGRSPAIA